MSDPFIVEDMVHDYLSTVAIAIWVEGSEFLEVAVINYSLSEAYKDTGGVM